MKPRTQHKKAKKVSSAHERGADAKRTVKAGRIRGRRMWAEAPFSRTKDLPF